MHTMGSLFVLHIVFSLYFLASEALNSTYDNHIATETQDCVNNPNWACLRKAMMNGSSDGPGTGQGEPDVEVSDTTEGSDNGEGNEETSEKNPTEKDFGDTWAGPDTDENENDDDDSSEY